MPGINGDNQLLILRLGSVASVSNCWLQRCTEVAERLARVLCVLLLGLGRLHGSHYFEQAQVSAISAVYLPPG